MTRQFLFDSAFANGAYSHSFGLETYISWGVVKDAKSYEKWLNHYMLDNFANSDFVVYAMGFRLKNKPLSFLKLARSANASILSSECKIAAINTARATLKNTEFMHDDFAKWYFNICQSDDFAHPALAFSALSNEIMPEYAYACIKSLTQNATRAIPLSYKKSSQIIYENKDLAQKVMQKAIKIADENLKNGYFSLNDIKDDIFATHFELDLAMLGHEKVDFRLFMS